MEKSLEKKINKNMKFIIGVKKKSQPKNIQKINKPMEKRRIKIIQKNLVYKPLAQPRKSAFVIFTYHFSESYGIANSEKL